MTKLPQVLKTSHNGQKGIQSSVEQIRNERRNNIVQDCCVELGNNFTTTLF